MPEQAVGLYVRRLNLVREPECGQDRVQLVLDTPHPSRPLAKLPAALVHLDSLGCRFHVHVGVGINAQPGEHLRA